MKTKSMYHLSEFKLLFIISRLKEEEAALPFLGGCRRVSPWRRRGGLKGGGGDGAPLHAPARRPDMPRRRFQKYWYPDRGTAHCWPRMSLTPPINTNITHSHGVSLTPPDSGMSGCIYGRGGGNNSLINPQFHIVQAYNLPSSGLLFGRRRWQEGRIGSTFP